MEDVWPWDQPPNCAVLTERSIVNDAAEILYVSHDLDDHGWQFLSLGMTDIAEAMLVALAEICQIDPTVEQVAHIPPGWHAWRKGKASQWTIEQNNENPD